ncbi:MAG: tRNA pseudouridine(38-40) synthase TruA [Promethearchaeota archaeon]|nr:MAG: tRNA pseudouridine(38-40) synthase TruA [Candidatus Lokiarchaeota archaeon]
MKIQIKPQRYLLKLYYIGTKKFHGSQKQREISTIENFLLESLISTNYINDYKTSGFEAASRTDKFVSARSAVFSFISQKEKIIPMEINSILPKEIGIWAHAPVDINFSSRFNAIYRHYKYIVPKSIAFIEKEPKINLEIMNKACRELEGNHNFINFTKRERGIKKKTNRTILSATININDGYLIFDFKSRAFLRQQIRRIVKKILELGKGQINYSDFLTLFDSSKEISYQPSDPTGLILWDIKYDEDINFIIDQKSKERMMRYFLNQEINYSHKYQLFKILQQNNFS